MSSSGDQAHTPNNGEESRRQTANADPGDAALAPRRGVHPRATLIFVATIAIAFVAFVAHYLHASAPGGQVAGFVPTNASWAVRIRVQHLKFFEPARKHLLPLIQQQRAAGSSIHQMALNAGVELARDLRELLIAEQRDGNWLFAFAGQWQNRGMIDAFEGVVSTKDGSWKRDGDLLVSPSGWAAWQDSQGPLVLVSNVALARGYMTSPTEPVDSFWLSGPVALKAGLPPDSPLGALTAYVPAGKDLKCHLNLVPAAGKRLSAHERVTALDELLRREKLSDSNRGGQFIRRFQAVDAKRGEQPDVLVPLEASELDMAFRALALHLRSALTPRDRSDPPAPYVQ